jgi:class 3 adenylate cyclase
MAVGFIGDLSISALNSQVPWLVSIGHVIAGSDEILLVYILLSYPWGRLTNRFDRWAIGVLTVLFFTIGSASVLAAGGTCLYCASAPENTAASALQAVSTAAYAIAAATVLVRVFQRYFRASPPARRILAPVFFGGVVTVMVVVWREISPLLFAGHTYSLIALSASDAALALIPIGLLVGFMRLRLERASIGALAADLALGSVVREQLQEVLARRLGDPMLQVGFWSAESNAYLDRDALVLDPARVAANRTVSLLDRDAKPDVAIVYDAALAEDPALFDQVGAVVRLAVANITDRLPAGTVTFMSSDIERSTELLSRLGQRYGPVLSEHRRLLRQAVARNNGYVVDSRADEFFAVFTEPRAAVSAALEAQSQFAEEPWSNPLMLKVRMGIHTGEPELVDSAYVGLDVHHAIRVTASARGGQILLSEAARVAHQASDMGVTALQPIGMFHLKGFPEPEPLYELS